MSDRSYDCSVNELYGLTPQSEPLALFEICTRWVGESYERYYAWANGETEARVLAERKMRESGRMRQVTSCRKLFNATDEPFCSELSDSGFNDLDL